MNEDPEFAPHGLFKIKEIFFSQQDCSDDSKIAEIEHKGAYRANKKKNKEFGQLLVVLKKSELAVETDAQDKVKEDEDFCAIENTDVEVQCSEETPEKPELLDGLAKDLFYRIHRGKLFIGDIENRKVEHKGFFIRAHHPLDHNDPEAQPPEAP